MADLFDTKAKREHTDLAVTLNPGNIENPQGPFGIQTAKKKLQAQMMSALMCIDKPAALDLLSEWSKYAETSAKTSDMKFDSLEKYLQHRYQEAAIP